MPAPARAGRREKAHDRVFVRQQSPHRSPVKEKRAAYESARKRGPREGRRGFLRTHEPRAGVGLRRTLVVAGHRVEARVLQIKGVIEGVLPVDSAVVNVDGGKVDGV